MSDLHTYDSENNDLTVSNSLILDLKQYIEQARNRVSVAVNSEITLMYWHIGERINRDVLGNQRAEYGKQIVATISEQLKAEYGKKGFDEKSIRRMMQFAQLFPDLQIVAPLVRQLSWSHFIIVMPLKDELQREFYLTMAAAEKWSKRVLQSKIDGMLYERTIISGKPGEFIKKNLANYGKRTLFRPIWYLKVPISYNLQDLQECITRNH